jgi:hypothetical protein
VEDQNVTYATISNDEISLLYQVIDCTGSCEPLMYLYIHPGNKVKQGILVSKCPLSVRHILFRAEIICPYMFSAFIFGMMVYHIWKWGHCDVLWREGKIIDFVTNANILHYYSMVLWEQWWSIFRQNGFCVITLVSSLVNMLRLYHGALSIPLYYI